MQTDAPMPLLANAASHGFKGCSVTIVRKLAVEAGINLGKDNETSLMVKLIQKALPLATCRRAFLWCVEFIDVAVESFKMLQVE